MTASVTPEPTTPAGVNGVEPGTSTPEASPPSTRTKVLRIVVLLAGLASLALGLAQFAGGISSLGGLFGPGVVESSSVASQIQSRVSGGYATCSDDLRAEVGATITCTVLDGADTFSVRATVTGVEGDNVRYDLEQVS